MKNNDYKHLRRELKLKRTEELKAMLFNFTEGALAGHHDYAIPLIKQILNKRRK